ncbi:hypothetical protein [Microseira wollei]|nr:hypothetical protein [Microseira wollei]
MSLPPTINRSAGQGTINLSLMAKLILPCPYHRRLICRRGTAQ